MGGFKASEIIVIVIALAIPVGMFVALLIPGVGGAIAGFLLDPARMPIVFYGGAIVLFGILAWRFYRRIRPKSGGPRDTV
jgi:membrane protein implicated in regulation of membrane protease activity